MNLPINQIICGDALQVLKEMPSGAVNCCISSPPYWALRDYGVDGQLGLEKTFEEYIDKLCTIYDEVRRVLRNDGTCFVNLGDTYGTHAGTKNSKHAHNFRSAETAIAEGVYQPRKRQSVPEKSLCLIPQRFAIEMVNRGWILRNTIVWHKPNPMPSSAKDRFTVDFEDVMFFVKSNQPLSWIRPDGVMVTKQPDYKSGKEGLDWEWGERKKKRVKLSLWKGYCYFFEPQYEPHKSSFDAYEKAATTIREGRQKHPVIGGCPVNETSFAKPQNPLGRNKRTVWTIPTQGFAEAHFATFPEKLVEPMILSGCPREVCVKCGQSRRKVYETPKPPEECYTKSNLPDDGLIQSGQRRNGVFRGSGQKVQNWINENPPTFKGYTDCGCKDAEWTPGVVLDPFSVAERLARSLPRTEGTGSESNSSRSISKWQCAA